MKTETHPFDGVGDNSVFQTKLDLREETLKRVCLHSAANIKNY